MRAPEETFTGETAAKISNAVVKVLHEYTGRGPTKAKTYIGDELVSVVLADTLTRGERTLVAGGSSETVLDVRKDYQRMMRTALVGAVEGITGRNVIAFMSDNHIDPDYAVETFVLEAVRTEDEPAAYAA
ncbi:MAG: hypothetical protein QOK25_2485 [Thermoleophilaceae bacterium]|jgi:uncharacterized protein YbcI|nr:hypothetical protein [Thermoleophilaceae bacterium]